MNACAIADKPVLDEHDKWQLMMHSCRKACRIIGEEYSEPGYLDWRTGAYYHRALWGAVRQKEVRCERRGQVTSCPERQGPIR